MTPALTVQNKDFFVGLANLKDEDAEEFAARDVFLPITDREGRKTFALELARTIRRAWREEDADERQWMIFVLRAQFANRAEADRQKRWWKKPRPTEFDALLAWFARNPSLFRYCQHDDCQHRFYIPNTRKPTKYCSVECAVSARLETRRRSYHLHKGDK